MKIKAKRIKSRSLYKLVLFSMLIPIGLLFIFCGIVAFCGGDTVNINGKPVTGIYGLISSIAIAPFFILICASISWFSAVIGLFMFSLFRNIELEFVEGEILSPKTIADNDSI